MSELPKTPPPADDVGPDDAAAERNTRTDELPMPGDPDTDENPHIGDVLADPNTISQRRG